jgi:prepilin-type N-terminal cleavage/methylation domain-containing protein
MKKLKSQKGFTLVEMLACVVMLMLLAGICSAGTSVAMNSYNMSLFESNSQMVESTLELYMGDIIRHGTVKEGTDPDNPTEKKLLITNPSYGIYDGWIELVDGHIYVRKTKEDTTGMKLLAGTNYTQSLKVNDFTLNYNEAEKSVTGTYKIESTVVAGLEKKCDFTYKLVTD